MKVINEGTLKTLSCSFQVWRQSSRKYLEIHLVCLLEVASTFWMKMRVSSWSMNVLFPKARASRGCLRLTKTHLPADRFEEGGEKIIDRDKAALRREKGVGVAGM